MLYIIGCGILAIAALVNHIMDEKLKGLTGTQIACKIVAELLIGIVLLAIIALIVLGFFGSFHECIVDIGKMG